MTGTDLTSPNSQQQLEYALLSQLTKKEIQVAARASYDYRDDPAPKDEEYARLFAQRFLRSTGDPEKALHRVKATLAFRQQIDVDGIRLAFDNKNSSNKNTSPLKAQLENESLYVQGFDKAGRSTYIFKTGKVLGHDQEWTVKSHIYTLERALACSKATDGTVNAMIDFKGFSLMNAPPMQIGTQFMTTFRDHYAGSIHQIFLLDAPLAFFILWKVMKGFVGTKTRDKIHFISSSSAETKGQRLTELYDKEQLAPWMMEGGTNNRPFDLQEYLHETAFDSSFGETQGEGPQ